MTQLVTEKEQQEAVSALEELISVPSYNQAAEDGAPFGRGIRNALDKMMEICERLGLKLMKILMVTMAMLKLARVTRSLV